jgi:diaminohydroxyphosphoribosylaminopyrimidine deaminase/5-amino-6-(5-phosphoribosylamino)uracil reductase
MLPSILELLHRRGVQSVLVEGGRVTLQSFLRSGLWDECRLIRSRHLLIPGGYPAPDAPKGTLISTLELDEDRIEVFNNPSA